MVRPSLSWKASYTVGVNVFLLHLVRILCQEDSAILNGAVKVCSGLEIHFMQKIFFDFLPSLPLSRLVHCLIGPLHFLVCPKSKFIEIRPSARL